MSEPLQVAIRRSIGEFQLDLAFTGGTGVTALFGPSGAGKSLALQMIAGIVRPEIGRVVAGDEVLFDSSIGVNLPPQRRRIGYVPQNYALFPHLSVAGNVAYGLAGLDRHERERRTSELIATVELGGLERRRPGELSGGQQQRVALARALAIRPRLLLLDEPFSSLDEPLRASLRQELLAIVRRSGTPTLLVTHDLDDAYALAERIVVIDGGRVLQQDTRDEVYHHPASRAVAELMGIRNVLEATVVGTTADGVDLDWHGRRLAATAAGLEAGRRVQLCIRAARVMVVPPARLGSAPAENRLAGRIVEEALQGESHLLMLQLAGSDLPYDLEIELPGYVYYRLGLDTTREIEVALRREAIHVIPA